MDALSDSKLEPRPHFRVLPTPKKQTEDPRLWDVDERNSAGYIIEDRGSSKGPYRTNISFRVRTGKDSFVDISFVVEAELSKKTVVKDLKLDGRSAPFTLGSERPLSIGIPVVGGTDEQSVSLRIVKEVKDRAGSTQILFKMANDTKRARPKEGRETFDFGSLLNLEISEQSTSAFVCSAESVKGYGLLPTKERESQDKIQFRDYFISTTKIPRPLPGKQTVAQLSAELKSTVGMPLDPSIVDYVMDKIERPGGRLYSFQARAITEIARQIEGDRKPCVITARTAAGKTEAFLIPIINWILGSISGRKAKGVKALLFYPTKALASDQLQRIVELVHHVNKSHKSDPITVGVYHGDIEERLSLDIPLPIRCVLHEDEIQRNELQPSDVRLVSSHGSRVLKCKRCGEEYPFLLIDRYSVTIGLPDVLICTPDAINYALMRDDRRHVFFGARKVLTVCTNCNHLNYSQSNKCDKCGSPTKEIEVKPETAPQTIVLDELHLFSSLFGGNVSNFLKRLSFGISKYKMAGPKPTQFIATSATVRNPVEFGEDFFGSTTVSISTSDEDYDVESGFSKVIVFTTPRSYRMIDTVSYSLYEILRRTDIRFLVFVDSRKLCSMLLGILRQRLSADAKTEHLVEQVDGHNSSYTRQERAQTEEKFNAGKIRVLVATSTLEVGVDFKNLDGMGIYGAPYGFNNYLQRTGRAGRKNDALVINFLSSTDPIDVYYYRNAAKFADDPTQFIEQPPFPTANALLIQKHVLASIFDAAQQNGLDTAKLLKTFKHDPQNVDQVVLSHLHALWSEEDIRQASERLKASTTATMSDAQLPDAAIKKFNLMNLRKVDETVRVEFEEPGGATGRESFRSGGGGWPTSSGGSRGRGQVLRSKEEMEIVRKMRGAR